MSKSFAALLVLFLLQLFVSCASHHHDRFPSSDDMANEEYNRNHRGGRFAR